MDKTALVTGGFCGIGYAIARELASRRIVIPGFTNWTLAYLAKATPFALSSRVAGWGTSESTTERKAQT